MSENNFLILLKDYELIFDNYIGIGSFIPLEYYISFAITLYLISVLGIVLNKQKNILVVMLFFELMLFSLSFLSIIFSLMWGCVLGQIFSLLIIAIAVSESSIGLAILIALFYENKRIDFSSFSYLRG